MSVNPVLLCRTFSLSSSSIPLPQGLLGHQRWFHNQFSPFSPVLHCPLWPAELQACPLAFVESCGDLSCNFQTTKWYLSLHQLDWCYERMLKTNKKPHFLAYISFNGRADISHNCRYKVCNHHKYLLLQYLWSCGRVWCQTQDLIACYSSLILLGLV